GSANRNEVVFPSIVDPSKNSGASPAKAAPVKSNTPVAVPLSDARKSAGRRPCNVWLFEANGAMVRRLRGESVSPSMTTSRYASPPWNTVSGMEGYAPSPRSTLNRPSFKETGVDSSEPSQAAPSSDSHKHSVAGVEQEPA